VDLTRAKALGSIQRDQRPPAQAPERVEYACRGDRFEEQRIERLRRGAIQHQADIGIGWNGGHAEQGLAVRSAVSRGQRALMAQEGGASHEKHRERREANVGHRVFAVAARPFALIRKAGANVFQLGDQGLQDRHATIEPKIAPRRQAKSSPVPGEDAEIRELLLFRLTPVSRPAPRDRPPA
jgi:hypothetical protein